jgi:hypothetical protein
MERGAGGASVTSWRGAAHPRHKLRLQPSWQQAASALTMHASTETAASYRASGQGKSPSGTLYPLGGGSGVGGPGRKAYRSRRSCRW